MISPTVKQVLERAAADATYRELLLNNPDQALNGYSLTAGEITGIKQISREQLETMAQDLAALKGELSDEMLDQVAGGAGDLEANSEKIARFNVEMYVEKMEFK